MNFVDDAAVSKRQKVGHTCQIVWEKEYVLRRACTCLDTKKKKSPCHLSASKAICDFLVVVRSGGAKGFRLALSVSPPRP